MLRVQVCGGVVVEADGRRLLDAFPAGRQGRLVLAYLLCHRHRSVPRRELAELLWGDQAPSSWVLSLSAIVSKLRRFLTDAGLEGVDALPSAFGSYRLHLPDDVWVDWEAAAADVERAERAIRDGDFEAAIVAATDAEAIVGRGFLTDDCSWVDRQRERLRGLHIRALESTSEAHMLAGNRGRAVAAARRALALDDTREAGYRLLMQALAAVGERGEALRVWERCRVMLVEELGTDPSAETETVYLAILRDTGGPHVGLPSSTARVTRCDNVPTFRTSLFGRQVERKEIASLMTSQRLVTVTGPGGVGKTRLASEVARDIADDVADGVWFIDLLSVELAGEVPSAVARALLVTSMGDLDDLTAVCAHLREHQAYLVFDNCEHVVEAAGAAVETILDACPGVTVLATSRAPLGLYGEHLYRVRPLSIPPADYGDIVSLTGYDAVRLFVDRAQLVRPGFTLGDRPREVASICRRLDGLPLAIELAAARTGTLDPAEVARRLDDRFTILARDARGGRKRQDSLREVIAWSYDLLTPYDRACFRLLAVFVDGFALDAAEAIAGDDAIDSVSRLVDHSLVEFGDSRHTPYRMFDSVRAFATACLLESGEIEVAGQRHRDFYVSLTERGAVGLGGPDQIEWFDRIANEHANIGSALSFSHDRGDSESVARLAIAMQEFWSVAGRYRDAERWLKSAIAARSEPGRELARALAAAAWTAHALGPPGEASRLAETALELAETLGDEVVMADACTVLARELAVRADLDAAATFGRRSLEAAERAGAWRTATGAKQALALVYGMMGAQELKIELCHEIIVTCSSHGDKAGLAGALANLGVAHGEREEIADAARCLTEALDLHRQVGDQFAIALTLANPGYVALVAGDPDRASALNREALSIAVEMGHPIAVAFALNNLAESAATLGDNGTAARIYHECLSVARQVGQVDRVCLCLDGLGAVALADGDPALAVRLLAAAEVARERLGLALEHRYRLANELVLVEAREYLGADHFAVQWKAGRAHSPQVPARREAAKVDLVQVPVLLRARTSWPG
jgi:predicted ATPase/DNA-binding SARP family transcriptional activator